MTQPRTGNNQAEMRCEDLEKAVLRHGSDLAQWPDADRLAAERLIARDPAAAQLLAAEASLDRLIAQAVAEEDAASQPHAALAASIAAQAWRSPQARPAPRSLGLLAALQECLHLTRRTIWASGASLAGFAGLLFSAGLWISTPMDAMAEADALLLAELTETALIGPAPVFDLTAFGAEPISEGVGE